MTQIERKVWEKENGIESFGIKADEVYESINPENIKSIDELKKIVDANSKYLVLLKDVNGDYVLETKLSKHPHRYLANKDQMIQVGSNYQKFFDEGTIVGTEGEFELIKSVDNYIESPFFKSFERKKEEDISKSLLLNECNDPNNYYPDEATDGRERIKLIIHGQNGYEYNSSNLPTSQVYWVTCQATAYRRTIFWFKVNRTIHLEVDGWTHYCYYNNSGNWESIQVICDKIGYGKTVEHVQSVFEDYCQNCPTEPSYFYRVSARATQIECSCPAEITCNPPIY